MAREILLKDAAELAVEQAYDLARELGNLKATTKNSAWRIALQSLGKDAQAMIENIEALSSWVKFQIRNIEEQKAAKTDKPETKNPA